MPEPPRVERPGRILFVVMPTTAEPGAAEATAPGRLLSTGERTPCSGAG
ncbi:hypothetical protein CLV67_103458 [Actinoplanes italicus]|uniref:Uncharacterized protein n=1 Tax=Actinoplanes italicus TaxID=113567 RepID=A0A2T0KJK0_9ACTN|nr:hypothetical protein CLV67_103458 [Actinoplanes italicus]